MTIRSPKSARIGNKLFARLEPAVRCYLVATSNPAGVR